MDLVVGKLNNLVSMIFDNKSYHKIFTSLSKKLFEEMKIFIQDKILKKW